MENIKFTSIMKLVNLIPILFVILQLTNCKGQENEGVTYPKEKIMTTDKFNIEKYNKIVEEKTRKGEFDIYNHIDTLSNGNVMESTQGQDGTYTVIITPPVPALDKIYKDYYKNGFLKEETNLYIGLAMGSDEIKFGITKYYDTNGYLIKTVDESVKYNDLKIKPLDLLEILKREPLFTNISKDEKAHFKNIFQIKEKEEDITSATVSKALKKEVFLNPNDREDVKNVFLTLSKDKNTWYVTKDMYPFGRIELNIDSNSGKIINRQYIKETRP